MNIKKKVKFFLIGIKISCIFAIPIQHNIKSGLNATVAQLARAADL